MQTTIQTEFASTFKIYTTTNFTWSSQPDQCSPQKNNVKCTFCILGMLLLDILQQRIHNKV